MQIGLPSILTVIFVICKIFNYIDWSWWWVFSPLWIAFSLWMLFVGIVLALTDMGRR